MENNNLAVQIGNIISNALIKRQVVVLPSVGSLYADLVSSKLKSSSVVTPPKYVVKFSSAQEGDSLVDIIAKVAGCDVAVAEGIYSKWLDGARTERGVNIEGVGVLSNKNFSVASRMDLILNPEANKDIKLKRRRGGLIWIAVSIVACVLVGLCANGIIKSVLSRPKVEAEPVVAEVVVAEPETVVEPEVVVEEQDADSVRLECTTPPAMDYNPRYRLVYGVFSTMENAQTAAAEVNRKMSSVVANIRPYGKYFMVNVMESDTIDDCKDFMVRHEDTFTDLWISKRRGE